MKLKERLRIAWQVLTKGTCDELKRAEEARVSAGQATYNLERSIRMFRKEERPKIPISNEYFRNFQGYTPGIWEDFSLQLDRYVIKFEHSRWYHINESATWFVYISLKGTEMKIAYVELYYVYQVFLLLKTINMDGKLSACKEPLKDRPSEVV